MTWWQWILVLGSTVGLPALAVAAAVRQLVAATDRALRADLPDADPADWWKGET